MDAYAEALLDDSIAQTAGVDSLIEIRSHALHDRASVAQHRGQFAESLKFAWQAHQIAQTPSHKSRILADMAAALAPLGLFSVARDALLLVAATADEHFGKMDAARASLDRTVDVATRNKFNVLAAEAAVSLRNLEKKETAGKRTFAEPAAEIEEIAAAVTKLWASAARADP